MFLYIVNGQSQDIIIISVFSASFYWFISSDKIFSRKTITAIIITFFLVIYRVLLGKKIQLIHVRFFQETESVRTFYAKDYSRNVNSLYDTQSILITTSKTNLIRDLDIVGLKKIKEQVLSVRCKNRCL
ncbi:unnamed protein product [Rhizophagus irregularis]|nr:unnamed protein product [Rhizophagus irregularis]